MGSDQPGASNAVALLCANMANDRKDASSVAGPACANMANARNIAKNAVEPASAKMASIAILVPTAKTSYVKCAMANGSAIQSRSSST